MRIKCLSQKIVFKTDYNPKFALFAFLRRNIHITYLKFITL